MQIVPYRIPSDPCSISIPIELDATSFQSLLLVKIRGVT